MGLAGKKNKRKLNEDPNNTKWSRNETTFGQKILRNHGWEPGQFLGAQDASHASMHSAASSAPIKITLKDDTLGLGAKIRQKQGDECTGLDVFKDLLGRLNGESDEKIAQKQAMRSELKTNLYVERKFGPMRFVKGGLLVGDQITALIKQTSEMEMTAAKVPTEDDVIMKEEFDEDSESRPEIKDKKSKKRKAEDAHDADGGETDGGGSKKKKKKRSKDETGGEDQSESDAEKRRRKKEKKERKAREALNSLQEGAVEAKAKSKKERKEKKKQKDIKGDGSSENSRDHSEEDSERAAKKKKKKQKDTEALESPIASASTTVVASAEASGTSTPSGTGTSTPQTLSRHMVRSRNIASKRMAMADMKSLSQIFMVKPV